MESRSVILKVILTIFLMSSAMSHGAESVVLNNDSYLRSHMAWKDEFSQSMPLAKNWSAVEFDDSTWGREHCPLLINAWYNGKQKPYTYYLQQVRAKFNVKTPAKMKLSLKFIGGVVVYMNGKEVGRSHLPKGKLALDTEATVYPDDAYTDEAGYFLWDHNKKSEDKQARIAARIRTFECEVPVTALRKGVNILSLELHRAKLNPISDGLKLKKKNYRGVPSVWAHVGLSGLTLIGAGAESNIARPKGVQVWTTRASENLWAWSYGDPCETPKITLQSPRNGRVSAVAVISSAAAISGVKVKTTALKAVKGTGTIPATSIIVRYAELARKDRTFNKNAGYTGLLPVLPEDLEPKATKAKAYWKSPYIGLENNPVAGVNLPVWITVTVPADTKPGDYKGVVTLSTKGLKPTQVPVSLHVNGWRMPDDDNIVTCHNLYQSLESNAAYYKVPLWSDRHFELMGEVLAMSKGLGNRVIILNMIIDAYHLHNEESLVRWIKKGDGYEYDFSNFERYLDLYKEKVGEPKVVMLSVFQPYADKKDKKTGELIGASVSLLDPKTGKVEAMRVPEYGTPEGVIFWKDMLTEVKARLVKRSWWDRVGFGTAGDVAPLPTTLTMFKDVMPEYTWFSSCHPDPWTYLAVDKSKVAVSYREHVWSAGRLYDPDYDKYKPNYKGHLYPMPWKRERNQSEWGFPRYGMGCIYKLHESGPMMTWRVVNEATLQGNLIGIGRVGLDLWPIPHPHRKGSYQARSGPSGAHLGPSASTRCYLYPGPDGPLATTHSEQFREGLQIREALISLQQALDSKVISGELATRCLDMLDQRARYYTRTREGQPMLWTVYEGSGWEIRDAELFDLAAEVAKVAKR